MVLLFLDFSERITGEIKEICRFQRLVTLPRASTNSVPKINSFRVRSFISRAVKL